MRDAHVVEADHQIDVVDRRAGLARDEGRIAVEGDAGGRDRAFGLRRRHHGVDLAGKRGLDRAPRAGERGAAVSGVDLAEFTGVLVPSLASSRLTAPSDQSASPALAMTCRLRRQAGGLRMQLHRRRIAHQQRPAQRLSHARSSAALSAISGPMPAGSPVAMAMRGKRHGRLSSAAWRPIMAGNNNKAQGNVAMMSREQNDQLSRIGPGTLMGKLLRRYWAPFLLAAEIPEPDCPPVRVKLMGERLIAFRDSKGRIGLIDEFCAHRGASLWFGENEECGIRCHYHGWKYDVTGQCVDLPSEPEEVGLPQEHQIEILPLHREGRHRLGLYGPAGIAAAAAGAGMDRRQARAALRLEAAAGMQLPAGDGRRHRFQPRVVAARQRAQQGPAVQGQQGERVQRAGPHAAVRGRGIFRRPADRRAPQCRRRQILLAHHALDHALVHHHPAARRASARARMPGCRSTTRPAGPGASIIIPSAR